jgi:hypothetical protein
VINQEHHTMTAMLDRLILITEAVRSLQGVQEASRTLTIRRK